MKKLTDEHKQKLSEAKKRNPPKNLFRDGELHPRWSGDKPSYQAVHKWIRRHYGCALKCQNQKCVYPRQNAAGTVLHRPKIFHWANISGKYLRDVKDWMQLCPSCHIKHDKGLKQVII